MSRSLKICLIVITALLMSVVIFFGVFFSVFPLLPKVTINTSSVNNTGNTLLVASYNTASPWGSFFLGTDTHRRARLFFNQINELMPDTLGVQEMNSFWVEDAKEFLPMYEYYGVKRGGDDTERKSEMSGIFYLKDRFDCVEKNTFWISETPDRESRYEGAGCHRVCSYVVLREKTTGNLFAHLNTHLDNSSTEAQNLGGELIFEKSEELLKKYPNIKIAVTGDFNQYIDGKACQILLDNGFENAGAVNKEEVNTPTYHGWGKVKHEGPIDFIMQKGFKCSSYRVDARKISRSYVSDHYMILSEMEF